MSIEKSSQPVTKRKQSRSVAAVNRDDILGKLRSGMLLKQIAAEYGVSKQALQQGLAADPEYQEALHDQADSLIDESKEVTWAARDPIDIARAREVTKWAFRYAESIHARKWAPQSKMTVEHVGDLGERLRRASERTIEGSVVDVPAIELNAQVIDTKQVSDATIVQLPPKLPPSTQADE